jgi:hypothetical protein
MPRPGDPYASAFVAEVGQCWRMIHDRQGQATHCRDVPTWTGRWFALSGERWWRVWACPAHIEGLTGLREFGQTPRPPTISS